jgi:tetratricopeptide (TPR) repeat protein
MLWSFIYGLWFLHWIRWWNHTGMMLFKEAADTLEGLQDQESITIGYLLRACQSLFMCWLDLAQEGYELASVSAAKLEEADQPVAFILALYSLTINTYFLYLYEEEMEIANKVVRVASEMDDKWLLAFSLYAQGLTMIVREDFTKAREIAEENLALYEELGDIIGSSMPLIVLGHSALALDDLEKAREYYLRCLKISQDYDFHYSMQTASKYMAKVALYQGRLAEAEEYLHTSLKIANEIGFVRDMVNLILEYARLFVSKNDPENAISLLALVIKHPASDLYRMLYGRIRDNATELLESLKKEVSPAIFDKAVENGQNLDLDDVAVSLIREKDLHRS